MKLTTTATEKEPLEVNSFFELLSAVAFRLFDKIMKFFEMFK